MAREARVYIGMGGNLARAEPDIDCTYQAMSISSAGHRRRHSYLFG